MGRIKHQQKYLSPKNIFIFNYLLAIAITVTAVYLNMLEDFAPIIAALFTASPTLLLVKDN